MDGKMMPRAQFHHSGPSCSSGLTQFEWKRCTEKVGANMEKVAQWKSGKEQRCKNVAAEKWTSAGGEQFLFLFGRRLGIGIGIGIEKCEKWREKWASKRRLSVARAAQLSSQARGGFAGSTCASLQLLQGDCSAPTRETVSRARDCLCCERLSLLRYTVSAARDCLWRARAAVTGSRRFSRAASAQCTARRKRRPLAARPFPFRRFNSGSSCRRTVEAGQLAPNWPAGRQDLYANKGPKWGRNKLDKGRTILSTAVWLAAGRLSPARSLSPSGPLDDLCLCDLTSLSTSEK